MIELGAWASLTYNLFKDAVRNRQKFVITPRKDRLEEIAKHVLEIERWSSSINMFGLAQPNAIETSSIAISVTTQPRKFFSKSRRRDQISEGSLINVDRNFVILGDPGAGKTTIIKRLARTLITQEPTSDNDNFQFPILILGRNIAASDTLFSVLFGLFGFELEKKFYDEKWKNAEEKVKFLKATYEHVVLKVLRNMEAIVFIDGLDEIDVAARFEFEQQAIKLSSAMRKGSVLITCRSGDWTRSMQNFELVEMMPLSDTEIRQIVASWADEPEEFLQAIRVIPYREILDRPLFLTMLIMVFNQTDALPDSPVDVYHRVTNLLIEKWDAQRRVKRKSKYSGFLSEKKFKFLCAVSFTLTIEHGATRFSRSILSKAIESVAPKFGLPSAEWDQIRQEIEGHTGIIVESGFENFEFCHLTVQEFLSASHLVLKHDLKEAYQVLSKSPETVAVAISLSGSRASYLAEILGNIASRMTGHLGSNSALDVAKPFLRRLHMEAPIFDGEREVADALLILLHIKSVRDSGEQEKDIDFEKSVRLLLDSHDFEVARASALKQWKVRTRDRDVCVIEFKRARSYGVGRLELSGEASALLGL